MFASIQNGTYGTLHAGSLNTAQLFFSGFSDGAQMTSWLIELQARQQFPAGVTLAAGVLLSGGSDRCYFSPPDAVSNCPACTDTQGDCGGGSGSRGCSLTAKPLCCSYCCPANYTEDFYSAHPASYAMHPPCFLAQSGHSDFNADLCAAKVYYEARGHVGASTAPESGRPVRVRWRPSGALGGGRASPLAKECPLKPPEPSGDRGNCVDHVSGFAAMVVPLTGFLLKVIATTS